jgi:NTE family protein
MARDLSLPAGSAQQSPARSVGLVLGAGGIAGWAWLVGCLDALQEVAGWDVRKADLVVGTSAGAGVAAMLRGGVSAAEQMARYRAQIDGAPQPGSGADRAEAAAAGPTSSDPAAPSASRRNALAGPGNQRPQAPQLALLGLLRWPPRPGVALAGLLPRGHHNLHDLADRLRPLYDGGWPPEPLWIPALRADTGRRVVFGRDSVDGADVVTAVRASAAIPGWYEQVEVGHRRYLDGGSWSSTNADLAAGLGFDLALVLAPLSVSSGKLRLSRERVRRAYHRSVLSREVDVVHRNGTDTVVVEPHPDDLVLFEGDPRDIEPARRLAIAERARERMVERLADDADLMVALGAATGAAPGAEAAPGVRAASGVEAAPGVEAAS